MDPMTIPGTVTITVHDFDALRKTAVEKELKEQRLTKSIQEVEVFLRYISNTVDVQRHIEMFNNQSQFIKMELDKEKGLRLIPAK